MLLLYWRTPGWSVAVLTDDLMPNVPISCLPPRRVDPEVQGLKTDAAAQKKAYFFLGIQDRPIQKKFLVHYFTNEPNAAASIAPILIRHWRQNFEM